MKNKNQRNINVRTHDDPPKLYAKDVVEILAITE
jgi:hypothetical protein